jgi:hypothetical protein
MQHITLELEITYLKTLVALFTSTAFSADTARASVLSFRSMFPIQSTQDAKDKVAQYVKEYPLFSSLNTVFESQGVPIETNDAIEKMRGFLASGNTDALLAASHEGNAFI